MNLPDNKSVDAKLGFARSVELQLISEEYRNGQYCVDAAGLAQTLLGAGLFDALPQTEKQGRA